MIAELGNFDAAKKYVAEVANKYAATIAAHFRTSSCNKANMKIEDDEVKVKTQLRRSGTRIPQELSKEIPDPQLAYCQYQFPIKPAKAKATA